MHVLLAASLLAAVLLKADWRNWHEYHTTMLYIGLCNLLYNLLCQDYLLWKYKPDFLLNHRLTDVLYTIIILPSIVLLYLSNYPKNDKKKAGFHIVKWVIASILIESVYIASHHLELQHGYKLWMEFLFYPCMYIVLKIHHSRPLPAYALSVAIILFMVHYFDVPLK